MLSLQICIRLKSKTSFGSDALTKEKRFVKVYFFFMDRDKVCPDENSDSEIVVLSMVKAESNTSPCLIELRLFNKF